MSIIYKNGHCERCNKNVKLHKIKANHILHLLLSIITFGLWLIVWFFVGKGKAWQCDECGRKAKWLYQLSTAHAFSIPLCFIFIVLSFLPEIPTSKAVNQETLEVIYVSDDIFFLQDLTKQGNSTAQYLLAHKYENGKDVPQNMAKSMMLYKAAEKQGEPYAHYMLHGIYLGHKDGIPKNDTLANHHLIQAAFLGVPQAQTILADKYYKKKTDLYDTKAFILLLYASEAGFPPAQALLAMSYNEGKGTKQDSSAAYRWNEISKANGWSGGMGKYGAPLEDEIVIVKTELKNLQQDVLKRHPNFPTLHARMLSSLKSGVEYKYSELSPLSKDDLNFINSYASNIEAFADHEFYKMEDSLIKVLKSHVDQAKSQWLFLVYSESTMIKNPKPMLSLEECFKVSWSMYKTNSRLRYHCLEPVSGKLYGGISKTIIRNKWDKALPKSFQMGRKAPWLE